MTWKERDTAHGPAPNIPHAEAIVTGLSVVLFFFLVIIAFLGFKRSQDKTTLACLKSEIRRLESGELKAQDRRGSMHATSTAVAVEGTE